MNNVENFLNVLAQQTSNITGKNNNYSKEKAKVIEKISLNFMGNYGRYQIFPFNDCIMDYPFVQLFDTREICIPRKITSADGTESVINSWVRLLPSSAYKMKDMTGRIVSSLTKEEEDLLDAARNMFHELYYENGIDAKNNPELAKDLMRKRNYTIFYGYCLNKWALDNGGGGNRNPERSNFSGLFVSTAKGFVEAVNNDVNEKTIVNGDNSFIEKIYNDKPTGREGFLLFSIARSKTSAGYNVTATHTVGNKSTVIVPDEDIEMFRKSCVESFLGWQANREDESTPHESRRLFNTNLIKEAVDYMGQQIQAIRLARSNGEVTEEKLKQAVKDTNDLILSGQKAIQSNDPMLKSEEDDNSVEDKVVANNVNPFATPAAGHFDPVTSTPVNNNNGFGGFGNFKQPAGFGGFGIDSTSGGDLPF